MAPAARLLAWLLECTELERWCLLWPGFALSSSSASWGQRAARASLSSLLLTVSKRWLGRNISSESLAVSPLEPRPSWCKKLRLQDTPSQAGTKVATTFTLGRAETAAGPFSGCFPAASQPLRSGFREIQVPSGPVQAAKCSIVLSFQLLSCGGGQLI